jgi:hypothetical protein
MTTAEKTHISFFDIHDNGKHGVVYKMRTDKEVDPGEEERTIEAAVRANKVPGGGWGYQAPEGGPLDIDETRRAGRRIFVFRLDDGTRLTFVRNQPFIVLPLNDAGGSAFLTGMRVRDTAGRWASFACHLDNVRGSAIAKRIKSINHDHPRILTIPFCFNVVDGLLDAAPWVVRAHPHAHHDESEDRKLSAQPNTIVTHGGVHPPTTSFIHVDLDEDAPGPA